MLKWVDVLIGLVVVVLALSMAVTVITQSITTLLNSRGRHLKRGLTDLLQQLDSGLNAALSQRIATAVLTHPLVSGSNTPLGPGLDSAWRRLLGGPRLGNVVLREEFTKLVVGLASDEVTTGLNAMDKSALKTALTNNGIADPSATLKSIRTVAMQIERASPDLSNTTRQTMAILQAAESDLVAKINSWFDQTMDRTAQRFTASTRAITFAGAVIVAFGLQVDTPLLVNRLAADDVLRDKLVAEAQMLPDMGSTPSTEFDQRYRDFLAESGVVSLPTSAGWWKGFQTKSIWGMVVTSLLLSLGAPFWYKALANLLQLRSALAVKDDAQRTDRQMNDAGNAQPSGSSGSGGAPSPITG